MKSITNMGRLLGMWVAAIMTVDAQAQSSVATYPTFGEMAVIHTAHRMLPLPDGRLILQGDVIPPSAGTNTVEVYDPETRTFQRVGHQLVTRWQDASAVLQDGRLLIMGGRTSPTSEVVGTAELLDPVSGVTTPTGSLNIPRTTHQAITLQDGRVLVIAGTPFGPNGTALASELYDPATGQFTLCGGLVVNRPATAFSTTVLQDGRVLVAGGSTPIGANAELFDPATETFQFTGAMVARRYSHTATSLPDGRVVFIGGFSTFSPAPPVLTNLVEVFDPATETFSELGTIITPRRNHTATLLADGRIMISGGWTNTTGLLVATKSVEVFDPATGTSEYVGDMGSPRADHRALAVPNGQVVITGGRNGNLGHKTAEIFDPLLLLRPEDLYAFYQEFANLTLENQQLWQFYNEATNVIWGLTVTNNNLQGQLVYANEIIDEQQALLDELQPNPFRLLPDMVTARLRSFSFRLPNGRVLLQGGTTSLHPLARSVNVFDPLTERFTTAGGLINARVGHTGNLLPDGTVLFTGGIVYLPNSNFITSSTEIYDVGTSNSIPGPSMIAARTDAASVNLADGRVLIIGGRNGASPFIAQSEIYEPSNQLFRLSGIMPERVVLPRMTLLQDGRVFIYGFSTNNTPMAQIFDPATETFRVLSGGLVGRNSAQVSLLPDGRVFISGGRLAGTLTVLNSTEIFDPHTETFTAAGDMLVPRVNFTSTTLLDGTVLLTGGQTNTLPTFSANISAEIFNPATGTFTSAGLMTTNRYNHCATLLQNGTVLLACGSAGGSTGPVFSTRAEIYDPIKHVPTSEFNNLSLRIDALEVENHGLGEQLLTVQQQYINATNVIWGLSITNAQLQQQLATCQSNEMALQFQIVGLTNQIGQLQGTVAALTAQNNALTNQVAQQAALIASLQAQNSTLTNQVATLTQQNQQLQTTLTNVDAQIAGLEAAFQDAFDDPSFDVPGTTLEQQIQNLIAAILNLNPGQRQALYFNLE